MNLLVRSKLGLLRFDGMLKYDRENANSLSSQAKNIFKKP
jgi:hypothetical protein